MTAEDEVRAAAAAYLAAGWRLVPIPSGHKGPTSKGWNTPGGTLTHYTGASAGIGLAHAYSGTCALDFDDLEAASAWLAARGVDLPALWSAPEAVRISSGRPNRGKLVYRLPPGVAPLASKQIKDGRHTLLEFRCATSAGLTVQDVLPPSIHPDTGRPYVWEYGNDLAGHWSALPTLPASILALWRALVEPRAPAAAAADSAPLGLTPGQLRGALRHIDPSCGYDDWLRAGMACHHDSGGQPYGLDVWDEWSAQSSKYPGRDALASKWDSFGRERSSLVTARWLMAQANVATAADFEDVPPAAPGDVRFAFEPAAVFAARPLPPWLIKNVLPQAGLAVVYGDSGSGKTFAVLDLALAVVLGLPWRGTHKTRRGRVAYLCAEGAAGFRKRLRAYTEHHGADLDGLFVHGGAPNLLVAGDVSDLVAAIKAIGGLVLVIVDTAAQVMPGGNENASEDMGKLIAAARRIHAETGALVLFIHHSGKDASRGARGWSGLRAACDAELEVVRDESGVRTIVTSKQKDAADGERLGFRLHVVEVGADEDGDPVTSCVVLPCEPPPPKLGRPGEGTDGKSRAQAAFEAIRAALLTLGVEQVTGVEARQIVAAVEPFASLDGKVRASRVSQAVERAVAAGMLRVAAGMVSVG